MIRLWVGDSVFNIHVGRRFHFFDDIESGSQESPAPIWKSARPKHDFTVRTHFLWKFLYNNSIAAAFPAARSPFSNLSQHKYIVSPKQPRPP